MAGFSRFDSSFNRTSIPRCFATAITQFSFPRSNPTTLIFFPVEEKKIRRGSKLREPPMIDMYLSRRMQSGSYAVYRQGLAEVLHTYNKVERKTSMNPYPKIILFGRDYSNQMSPQSLKLSNPVNAGKYFNNDFNNSKMQSSPPNPWFNLPSWGRWVIGSVISVVLSFWNNNRMQQLKRIKGEAELAVEGIEAVAEMVEKVATATEDMAEEMEKILPEQSKIKQVAVVLEHISEVAAHEAHVTHDFLQKVEKVAQDLDALEAMIEPLVDRNEANAETKQQDDKKEANSEPSRH